VHKVAGEGVEEAYGGVGVALQEEEAVGVVERGVVFEQREVDGDERTGVAVEEAHAAAKLGVAGMQPVALGEHHPPARVEAGIEE
jgi:hypothetical protein